MLEVAVAGPTTNVNFNANHYDGVLYGIFGSRFSIDFGIGIKQEMWHRWMRG
jgi:hypothetical protein